MNIGIIGLGRIGRVHLNAIQKIKGLKVLAISDVNEIHCKQIAKEHEIPHFYTDYKELIANKNIDAVWVCSPSNLHYNHVSEALKNDKYVFCEKPLETELNKIKLLINNFPDIDQRLMVAFNKRFDPDFSRAQSNFGSVGKATIVKIVSRDPTPPSIEYIKVSGGIFKDMMIHDFDMARFIVGDEVEEVFAAGAINYVEGIEGLDIDTSLVTLKFKNGVICNIDNSRQSAYGYDQRLEIHGSEGMIQVANKKENQCNFYTDTSINTSVFQNFFLERYEDAYEREVAVFHECIRAKKEFPVTAYDALKSLELAEACKKSYQDNRVVNMSEISS